MRRRDFLGQLVSASVGTALLSTHSGRPGTDAAASATATAADLAAVPDPPPGLTRTWLGPMLWANRLQDFRASNGRYECVATGRMRTVSLITYSLLPGAGTASLSMLTGTLANGAGFSGFLVGAGSGRLDYRAASLVQAASGTGGGLLCTYENDGRCRFRGHTSESSQLSYPVLAVAATGPSPARSLTESVRLTLDLAPSPTGPAGSFRLTLTARRSSDALLLSQATLDRVADTALTGGVLVASGPIGSTSSRCWFSTVTASGTKVGSFPERAMGPVLGTLFSLNGSVLKMTAQLFPVGASEPQGVTLRYRTPGSATWSTGPTATVGDGYTAQLRVGTWDVTRPWEYQVVYGLGTAQESVYGGTVPAAPGTLGQLTVGVVNCTIHSYRPLDVASPFTPKLAGETPQALYTPLNLYFPYAEVVTRLAGHGIDLLAALGDQFYENRPTQTDKAAAPTLDFLYKYYLWLWSFRDLTRNIPCVVLVDDHDMYQGNLWGHEGARSPGGDRAGGYVKAASWVNTVQRVQTGHNPDPYDPTPVQQGITVSYGAFTYGGVSFACLEDRKFKYGPTAVGPDGLPAPIETLPMLGARQEAFLDAWRSMHPGQPKVVLSQTTYAVVKTSPKGFAQSDPDNDAYKQARDRALRLVKNAKAVMVCGDQHLGNVVRHGLSTFTDGPVQFTVPAAGTAWQRWFEPAATLPNPEGTPHTGDFTDGYGNRMHVLASVNPVVTQQKYLAAYGSSSHNFGDRALKNEGYGVLHVDTSAQRFVIECWRWDTDPTAPGARQFPGWPQVVPFASA